MSQATNIHLQLNVLQCNLELIYTIALFQGNRFADNPVKIVVLTVGLDAKKLKQDAKRSNDQKPVITDSNTT